ncbi:MAG: hypothetical protein KGS48_12615 [Bacteroidetes bacterium]|nr:hypothetical protein [Bacteroidota bacterium]
MNKKLHHLAWVHGRALFNTILFCLFLGMLPNCLAAQASESASALISTEDLAINGWKETADYTAILAQERILATQEISNSSQNIARLALYTAYDRLLSYMQSDMAAKSPIETIADINYKKLVLETPNDPVLKDMDSGEFSVLYGNLVSKLVIQ